jgi:hypothetical protein
MSDPRPTSENPVVPTRRPYEAPCVLETAEFETLALGCNKIPDDFECELSGTTNS